MIAYFFARPLEIYEASREKLNRYKTLIVSTEIQVWRIETRFSIYLGSKLHKDFDIYLGLPALVGKSRTWAFKSIKDRVWKRLHNRKTRFLSQVGIEILLKLWFKQTLHIL
jgi:hypothetical protein